MSKFKFKTIKSYAKVLRVVKRDLWGNIILTNNNKFKRIFAKLYNKRRKLVNKVFKSNYIKNFLIISGGKLVNKRFFGSYLSKKSRKKRVRKYKKILNNRLYAFDQYFNKTVKLTEKAKNLKSKINLFKLPTLAANQKKYDKLITKLDEVKTNIKQEKIAVKILKKRVAAVLKRLKRSYYFKRLQNRKKKDKKRKKKLALNLEASKNEYVTEQQKMIYLVEMLKLKKKNFRLHIKVKKRTIINRLKKKKADLLKKLGPENLKKIDDIITTELLKYETIFQLDDFINERTKPEVLLQQSLPINKKIIAIKKKLKTKLSKKIKLKLTDKLIALRKKRRNERFLNDYFVYKENYKKTDDYKNKFDLKTLTEKKYDNSYFLKKYKNFFKKFLRNRYKPNFYDLNFRKKKRRQFKSILNLSYIKTYRKQIKTTRFGRVLNQQQTLKRYLGNLSSKKLRKLYDFFKQRKIGKNKYNFFLNLESTLFYTLIRSKLFINYIYLDKIIRKGYILINGVTVKDKFYKLKPFDKITFKPKKIKFLKLRFLGFYLSKFSKPLSTLLISYSTYSILFLNYPNLSELIYNFKISYNIFRSLYKKY